MPPSSPARAVVPALLLLLVLLPGGAASGQAPLDAHARALHALNRLTFGPRPEDVEQIQAMGLDKWIDLQLHPERIPDDALAARLAQFPALRLSTAQLLSKYPPNPLIRQLDAGKLALPADPVERAIYANELANYRNRRAQKAQGPEMKAGEMKPADMQTPEIQAEAGAMKAPEAISMSPEGSAEPDADPREAARLLALAPAPRWNAILHEQPGLLRPLVQHMKPAERLSLVSGFTPEQREAVTAMVDVNRVVATELVEQRLLRDLYSDRQLQEVMTDFWLNHFSIYLRKNEPMPWALVSFERDAIRPHALGHFEDLLRAVAHSPAMLVYLDNQQSIGPESLAAGFAARNPNRKNASPGLNENYARELMELHTLGVNGGYTQKDVTEVAKILTGWGVDPPDQGYGFHYYERRHEPGTKTVLGQRFSNQGKQEGQQEGEALLHLLAMRPATARFLSTRIATRFVSDTPPPALVDRMAKRYQKSHGDIRAVLVEMLHSPEFWAPSTYRSKVKTPLDFVASAIRATGANVENPASLVEALDRLGMPLYGVQQPNGYPLTSEPWLGSEGLLARLNFALALTANRLPGVLDNVEASLPPEADPAVRESLLEARLLEGAASPQTHAAVLAHMEDAAPAALAPAPPAGNRRRADLFAPAKQITPASQTAPANPNAPAPAPRQTVTAALLLGSPDFQRR